MPFAGYANFAQCVAKNKGKKDPKAYCATIMRATEEDNELKINGREIIDVAEAEFSKDEATGRMFADVVLIKAGRAKNPRNYRPNALRRAVEQKTYEGLRMFVNHSDKPPIKRNWDEMVSAVESTTWDPAIKPLGGIRARAEIFDAKFFEKAQLAKKYMGVSADHQIGITRVREGVRFIEDVHEIIGARSVDWVLFPSAGGEIIQFATESDEGEDVDWDKLTLDDLKANAPEIIKQLQAEGKPATEGKGPEDDDDEGEADEEFVKKSDVGKIVQEQVQAIQKAADENSRKRTNATKQTRDFVAKSGLPSRVQSRLVNQFSDSLEYDEASVKEAVEEAKEELKEAGAGKPRITDMGASGGEEKTPTLQRTSARESVEAAFGGPFKKTDDEQKKK
jgi:5-carboxymethyl-2-hydroxymuconate isomerase